MWSVLIVGGGLGERGTRLDTNVPQREGGQYMSRMVQHSARSAGGGFGAEEVWRCTDAGEKRTWREVEMPWSLKGVWSAGSAAEPSADRETSRDTSVCTSGVNRYMSRGALSSARSV